MCVSSGAEVLPRSPRDTGIYRQDAFKSSTKEKKLKIKKILIQYKEKCFISNTYVLAGTGATGKRKLKFLIFSLKIS